MKKTLLATAIVAAMTTSALAGEDLTSQKALKQKALDI